MLVKNYLNDLDHRAASLSSSYFLTDNSVEVFSPLLDVKV